MKSVIITGANRSIGLELVKQLSKKGFFVYLGTRDLKKGTIVAAQLKEEGFTNIQPVRIDITQPDTILAARDQVEKEQGKLDVLINNAGISNGFPDSVLTCSVEKMQRIFDTNFFGTISVTQAFMELLKKSDCPRISNITSGLASLTLHSDPAWKYYPFKMASYIASKTALNAYTVLLAYEVKGPFKVNAIDPGYTATEFNGFNGPGTVECAASFILKHTLVDENGPTGKFFSKDSEEENEESPW